MRRRGILVGCRRKGGAVVPEGPLVPWCPLVPNMLLLLWLPPLELLGAVAVRRELEDAAGESELPPGAPRPAVEMYDDEPAVVAGAAPSRDPREPREPREPDEP